MLELGSQRVLHCLTFFGWHQELDALIRPAGTHANMSCVW